MRRREWGLACGIGGLLAALAGAVAGQTHIEAVPLVRTFSSAKAGNAIPHPWESIRLSDAKPLTRYSLVDENGGGVVLRAEAVASASALGHPTDFDITAAPHVEWRWKVGRLLATANNAHASREDAIARVVLAFDGNKSRLPLLDRAVFALAHKFSGRHLPYATLMYVRATTGAVGTIIANPYTGRVRMVVASSGPDRVGQWESLRRDVRADFLKAFGEEPGRLVAVGVMTDTDNTGETADAWYGDIRFLP